MSSLFSPRLLVQARERVMLVAFVSSLIVLMSAQHAEGLVETVPATVSPDEHASWISFNADQSIMVFGRHDDDWGNHRVMMTYLDDSGWRVPELVEIDGAPWPVAMRAMRFAPDGRSAVFASAPLPGEARDDWDLWFVRFHEGRFVAARRLEEPVNSSAHDFHASIAANGTIYFASRRNGGAGASDLYRARPDLTAGWRVERLADLSSALSEADIYVAPDESFVVFTRTDAPDGQGGDDLYISYARADGWGDPTPLGPDVNTTEYEYGAWVNADQDMLWFTSFRQGVYGQFLVALPPREG